MATLTSKKRKELKSQLDAIQTKLNEIKASRAQATTVTTPTPTAAPLTGNSALDYGASGRGEYLTPELNAQIEKASSAGVPMSELGSQTGNKKNPKETYLDRPDKFQEPTLSSTQAAGYVKSFGLEGMVDAKKFAGKTAKEVNKLLIQERAKRTGQVSQNTSFAFNPEILKRTQRAIDKFGFALNDVTNDPFEPKEFKDEEAKNTIEVTSKEIGSLFDSPDELYAAYNTNQQFRDSFDKFVKKGGTLEGVSKNITAPTVDTPLQQAQSELNNENTQTPAQYLASLTNPNADPKAQKMALEELAPESEIAQNEISRVSGIPDQLKSLYFGNEKTMGLLQMKQEQAKERVRIIEEQERDAKRTVKDKARLSVERYRVEVEQAESEIEENRLAAKNYMTAQLAKLGALNTTGTAPLALQTLETKYQAQTSKIRSSFKLAQREIEIGLDESLDEIENNTDELILGIQEDTTKDRETAYKEILKAQNDADKQIYTLTEQYARRLRERTSKYTDDLKAEAEKYAKEFAKNASNGLDGGPSEVMEGQYVDKKGVLLPNGKYAKLDLTPTQITQVQSAGLSGEDTIRYFLALPEKFRSLLIQEAQSGGVRFNDSNGSGNIKFNNLQTLKKRYEQLKKEDEAKDEDDEVGPYGNEE
jgi:hypothetical protein